MVDAETTATDTDGKQHNEQASKEDAILDNGSLQIDAPISDATPPENSAVPSVKRNSDVMTSSQFFEAERKKNGSKTPERKVPDAAEAELRSAKLREMELIEKNRVEVIPAKKGTNWGPILLVVGILVVIAVLWSWLS
jgi:hypothetical protein